MIYCPQCGTPNFDDANYCNTCGEPLVNPELYDQIRNKAEMEAYLEKQQREREAQAYSKAYKRAQKEAKREAARQAKEQSSQTAAQPMDGQQGAPSPSGQQSQHGPTGQPEPQGGPQGGPQGPMPHSDQVAAAQSEASWQQVPPGPIPGDAPEADFPVYKHGCLAQAWDDITESPGWGKRICLLGLVNMVPVLNFFVTGYSMGWAAGLTRDEVRPMPDRIFADGSFLQGFYAFVISLVLALVTSAAASMLGVVPVIGGLCGLAVGFISQMYWALAVMRVQISNSFGRGFDVPAIFKEIFSDRFGKVFSVSVVPSLIVGAAILFICGSLMVIFGLGLLGTIGNVVELASYGWYSWGYVIQSILAIIPLVFVMYLISAFLGAISIVLTLRATAHYIVRYERSWTMLR